MAIKSVFFDFYNTIGKFDPPRERLQMEICSSFNIDVKADGIIKGYGLADAYMAREIGYNPLQNRNKEQIIQFFAEYQQLILNGAGVDISIYTAEQMFRKLRKLPYDFALYEDVIPILKFLKNKGLVIGLLSNNDKSMDDLCVKLGLSEHLDFTLTSGQVGSGKPNPQIFLRALEIAGSRSNETIHVGDQYESDIKGAVGVGIRPILIDRDNLNENFTECPRITNLLEIRSLID
jgi:putative hydrolase of the HAD superfamily